MKALPLAIFAGFGISLAVAINSSNQPNCGICPSVVAAILPQASAAPAQTRTHTIDGKATKTSWPSYRGDRAQLGVSPATIPDKLELKWKFKTAGPIMASAVIDEGKAYIGSDDGRFYCIDIKSGKQIWAFDTKDGPLPSYAGKNEKKLSEAIEAPGVIIGDKVVFGCTDGMLYCLDAGTGCGWCVPTLEELHRQHQAGEPLTIEGTPEEYASGRKVYQRDKRQD